MVKCSECGEETMVRTHISSSVLKISNQLANDNKAHYVTNEQTGEKYTIVPQWFALKNNWIK